MPKKVKKLSPGDWVKVKKSADVADLFRGAPGVFVLKQDDGISKHHYLVVLPSPSSRSVAKIWFSRNELKRIGGLS